MTLKGSNSSDQDHHKLENVQASWRNDLKIHPAAELFPLLPPDELRTLGENIIKNGLHVPVALWSDGKSPALLLDGRNRLDGIELVTGSPVIIGAPSLSAGNDFLATDKLSCSTRRSTLTRMSSRQTIIAGT